MEHPQINTDNSTGSISTLLIAVAWLFNMAITYDNLFKFLTIVSLLLVIFVNIGKGVAMVKDGYIFLKNLFKSK